MDSVRDIIRNGIVIPVIPGKHRVEIVVERNVDVLTTPMAMQGLVTAPHHLAAASGAAVLRDGGNAIEAMVAAAATIAVVYPHMNSIGGDGFWLIYTPGQPPLAIDACGATGAEVCAQLYQRHGLDVIPARGPLAANTVAGTVSGWQAALDVSTQWGGTLSLTRLLADAIAYSHDGIPVTPSQYRLTHDKLYELREVSGFAETFLHQGAPLPVGARFQQPRLAATLALLAERGLDDFYRGELARRIAADLARAGSPITAHDLARHQARVVAPLSVTLSGGTVYNLPPPTQGLASLLILALFERLGVQEAESFAYVHGLVEATKQAFLVRDHEVTDPAFMQTDPQTFLGEESLGETAKRIDPTRALPWPQPAMPGDTVWMGAVDSTGRMVSFIQSLYWEFGSGVVLEETGMHWQNRGSSFELDASVTNPLGPDRKPFHTLNPALAVLTDGRVMAYGTMGGEGQPQTQAALYTRYAMYDQGLQEAITAPRWLLGRTWGQQSTTLKLESRFPTSLIDALAQAGHDVEVVDAFTDLMGHAGAVVSHPSGLLEGASDPRGDGGVAVW